MSRDLDADPLDLKLIEVDLDALVRKQRPQWFSSARPLRGSEAIGLVATNVVPRSDVVRAKPTVLQTSCCSIASRCNGSLCAEAVTIKGSGAPILDAPHEIRRLAREYGAEPDTDAVSVALVAWEGSRFVSLWRGESAFAEGAAHSTNGLRCTTFDLRTGKPLTLQQAVGRRAHEVVQGALAPIELLRRETGKNLLENHRLDPDSFLLRSHGDTIEIIFCAVSSDTSVADGTVIEVPSPQRWMQ